MIYFNEFDPQAAEWLRELIREGLLPQGEVDERSITEVSAADLAGFRSCHFFAGIGGWPLALRLAGWGDERPVWTGSCPCQPYSSAGKRKGEKDERDLWPEFHRLIAACRPGVVFGEQVASADVIGKAGRKPGKPARRVWLDRIHADLEAAGYAFGACVLGAHSVGAPHIRQRLFWGANAELADADGRDVRGGGFDVGETPRGDQGEGHQRERVWSDTADGCEPRRMAHPGQQPSRDDVARSVARPDSEPLERRGEAVGEPGGVADREEQRRRQGRSDGRGRSQGDDANAGAGPEHGRGDGILADADGRDASDGDLQRGGEQRLQPPGGRVVPVGDPDRFGEGSVGGLPGGPGAERIGGAAGVSLGDTGIAGRQGEAFGGLQRGELADAGGSGFWSAFGIVHCCDNKARRVEPGSFPLASGIPRKLGPLLAVLERMGVDPAAAKRVVRNYRSRLAKAGRNRVSRLRGYGNAIVPDDAAAFIQAWLEVTKHSHERTT